MPLHRCHFVELLGSFLPRMSNTVACQFNDKPEGGGDRTAHHSTPKMPLHRCHFVELLGSFLPRMSNTVACQFNDKPEGGGDRTAHHSTPKMPLHRRHFVELLGSFLPRMSNTVACRLIVKLAEGFNFRPIESPTKSTPSLFCHWLWNFISPAKSPLSAKRFSCTEDSHANDEEQRRCLLRPTL